MRIPGIHYMSHQWLDMTAQCSTQVEPGRYDPARPEPFFSVCQRWQAAWMVFTGKADALVWPGQ